ncbi:AraC family transcriptional regulator [Mucilaginibacter sp. RCC_168]|uniref:AraC family transcriptional regulator n=1 Tax=Mucilaginibacter sp. RCC_168 TaxID=3239221 RepID=UPI0035250F42
MRPLIQKLPYDNQTSFVTRTYRTPHFEVGWHQHIELELILFTEGSGLGFVGNHVSEFETDDIYFIGSNLPHTFQKSYPELITSAVVVQFRDDFWGSTFIELPEMQPVRELFMLALQGLKLNTGARESLAPLIRKLEFVEGFERILLLGQCLQLMAVQKAYKSLSTSQVQMHNPKSRERIDRVFQFTVDNFKEPISLEKVAAIACLSVPAFCNYFKKSTQKTYIDFLNETRISYACHLLLETLKPIPAIAYDCGYNTSANFHKQFLKVKMTTPLQYRKLFVLGMTEKGANTGIVDVSR